MYRRKFYIPCVFIAAVFLSTIKPAITYSRNASPVPGGGGPFKVAMLLPGSVNDQSFNTNGFRGLSLLERKLGAVVAYTENVKPPDMERLFREYAVEGYHLVVGWGAQFLKPIEKVAEEFPRTNFMILGYYAGNNRNLGAISFWQGEIGYLAGCVAGLKTRTNKVCFLTGFLYPHQKEKAILFRRGVKAVNPKAVVRIVAINTWTDRIIAKKSGHDIIARGYDVIAVDADSAGSPIHLMAAQKGCHTIGWTVDQYGIAPKAILTSALQRAELVVLEGAKIVRLGQWEGKQYKFGLQTGVQDLAPFRGALTPEEAKQVFDVRAALMAGKIDILMNPDDPL